MNLEEIDYQEAAVALAQDVLFALKFLKSSGGGCIATTDEKGDRILIHWRDRFMNNLQKVGFECDREACHALDLPARKQKQFFKAREARKKAARSTPNPSPITYNQTSL